MKRILGFVALFSLLSINNAWAWWSVAIGNSTHYEISSKVISYLPASDYPDMQLVKFGQYIVNSTSGMNDDKNAHDGTTIPNGGDVQIPWNQVKKQYKAFNAYYYITLANLLITSITPSYCDTITYWVSSVTKTVTVHYYETCATGCVANTGRII